MRKTKRLLTLLLALALAVSLIACGQTATEETPPEEQANEETLPEAETAELSFAEGFASPPVENRPLTRWWVPGALMTKEEIKAEIESMSAAGFGGAEVVPVAVAGAEMANGEDAEPTIEWGTPEWNELIRYMLEVAGENSFTIDFTMTPAWPLALPTIQNVDDPDEGAQMEMDGASVDLVPNAEGVYALPVSAEAVADAESVGGTVTLVGVTVAKYADKDNKVLAFDSAKALDLSEVSANADGVQTVSFTPDNDGDYVLFAWYQHPSGNQKFGNNQVDHFSKAGARKMIDYWEENLIPAYGDAFQNVRSLFIDSLEFETHLDWTYGLLEGFQKANGYDLTPYLPALYDTDAVGNYMGDPEPDYSFDENSVALRNDYREYLTQLYINEHIKPLQEFCARHGVTLRYQTSYGKSLETARTALYPDIPETESLYGSDYMDFYRLQAGAVHVTGKPIYSMETAAEWTETWNPRKENGEYGTRGHGEKNSGNYEQTFQDHLWHDQRAFATGVNQAVFHGYPYNGQYGDGYLDGIEWPGFNGFDSYRWSNSWGERQPNWMFARDYLDYITRTQYVLRQGTPKEDVAVYRHSYYEIIDFWGPDKILTTETLEQNGYSYDFLSPAALDFPGMAVSGGVLNASGPAYKALVVPEKSDLPYSAAEKLLSYAKDGLPIIIVGEAAKEASFYMDEDISALMDELLKESAVKQAATLEEIVPALRESGVTPDASYENETLLATHRQDTDADYYYLYNYGGADSYRDMDAVENVRATVTLKGAGQPYELDAWTGDITPIADYTELDGAVSIDVDIAANDVRMIALFASPLTDKEAPAAKTFAAPVTLNGWTLEVESWTKGDQPTESQKTSISVGELERMETWDKIPGLEDASGIGVYTTSFEWGADNGDGAYLDMGRIKDAFGLKVNGETVTVNQIDPCPDISACLKDGENTVEITIATSLLNALLAENRDVLNDAGRVLDDRDRSSYGLFEDVSLIPYANQ